MCKESLNAPFLSPFLCLLLTTTIFCLQFRNWVFFFKKKIKKYNNNKQTSNICQLCYHRRWQTDQETTAANRAQCALAAICLSNRTYSNAVCRQGKHQHRHICSWKIKQWSQEGWTVRLQKLWIQSHFCKTKNPIRSKGTIPVEHVSVHLFSRSTFF